MPIFEYICRDCAQRFDLIVQASTPLKCPNCGGADLEKQLSRFAVGKTQQPPRPAAGPCATCPAAAEGGCGMDA